MELVKIETAKINNKETQAVNARELHEFLEVKSNFRDWIKNRINDFGFIENQEFITVAKNLSGGGKQNDYFLSLNMAKELSMVERNEKGRQARQYFIKCEEALKNQAPQIPTNLPDALRLAADLAEENQKLAIERDEAIKTKALIGSKREATAMATASAAVKEANKLKQQLDQSVEYATVKRMEMIHHGIKFKWQLLKSTSIEMGIPAIDVFDQNYGTVKAYHADVWKEAYAVEVA